jgi:hypothetical protein
MGFPLFALFAGALAALGAVAFGALIGRRLRIARHAGATAGLLVMGYAVMLWAVNGSSTARVLQPGESEALCGAYLDCHIGVSVTGAEAAAGRPSVRVVTLELSSSARAATLTPPALAIQLVDQRGRTYDRDLVAEEALGLDAGLDDPLGPGALRTVRLAFLVPDDAAAPRLRVRLADPLARTVESALLGDADGLFHAPVMHALDA